MNAFSKRFFVCISLILLGFTAISFEMKNLIFFSLFCVLLVIFYLILSRCKVKFQNLRLLCLLLFLAALLGVGSTCAFRLKNDYLVEEYSGKHTISGYVQEVSTEESFMSEYIVKIENVDDKKASFDMILVSDYQSELSLGDFIELTAVLIPLKDYSGEIFIKNDNALDYPILCVIDDTVEINRTEKEFRISLMLANLNSKLSSTLKAILGSESGSLASALLLGNRELLSSNILRDFKRAGVYHMLALSGLHVAILIGIVDWILKKLFIPRSIRIVVLTLLALFYVALTGFAMSACRSMLMLWLMYLSLVLGKRRDAMTALFASVSLIVLINPASILDLGLQLSFLSTFGVISASIIVNKIKWLKKDAVKSGIKSLILRLFKKLLIVLISTLCVFIMTLPLIMIYFGEVSLATFVSNIFMGVICEMFMIFSLLTLLLSWSFYLRFPFAEISVRIGEFMSDIVSCISDIEGVMLSLKYPNIEYLVWGMFIAFLVLLAVNIHRKWLIFIPSTVFFLLLIINVASYNVYREGFVRAEYLLGDKLIISSSEGVYICDASSGAHSGFYSAINVAKENCFTEIDGIVLSHYHSKHIVTLQRLVKEYKVRSILLPSPQNSDEDVIMRSIVRNMNDAGVDTYIYDNNRELDILAGKLAVSQRAYSADYAHPSVAISFSYQDTRVTLLERPYFNTYLEECRAFEEYISNSDYLIFGTDGRSPKEDFSIFEKLKDGCEVSFSDFELMDKSDFYEYMDEHVIYFDVNYKKYDLK